MIDLNNLESLHQSFSFFIALDDDLHLVEVSKGFEKLIPGDYRGHNFEAHFQVVKPKLIMSDVLIEMFTDQMFTLAARNHHALRFSGSIIRSQGSGHLIVGFPQVTNLEQLSRANLTLSDFLPHDPIHFYVGALHVRESAVRDMKALADTLSDRQTQLEEEVRRRTRELLHAEKMASVGTLAAGVAHEINNPLAYVRSNLQWLESNEALLRTCIECSYPQKAHEFDELRRNLAEVIQESLEGCDRIRDIVHSLRQFSHPDSGTTELVALEDCIQVALKICKNDLRHCAEVELNLVEIPRVMGNESEISQVILNLLVNAAHAIEDTPGLIQISTFRIDANRVGLSVADNGSGIDQNDLPHLFNPFFTTKEVGKGTGLGLSISHGIIEKMGGSIEVTTQPGEGSCFMLTFPIPETPEAVASTLQ